MGTVHYLLLRLRRRMDWLASEGVKIRLLMGMMLMLVLRMMVLLGGIDYVGVLTSGIDD